ncbi:unnamed protein product [Mycena citricolor]|uniref:DDB1- and CUL4-associated factor 13 n=1 Tax=Mycena citricolor TaxID=2018698 RepID=A0AAD2K356_9AGAR|nr:unnamed protein product [Mycena citricolor]
MKIKVLQHDPAVHLPQRPGDPTPVSRNLDPLMHPFSRARERTRALNAAKMDRMFAKPFVASLEGHVDAVEVMAKQPGSLTTVASGSWDGGLIVHHLARRTQLFHAAQAHKGKVSGVCFSREDRLFSCGVDRTVKAWNTESTDPDALSVYNGKTPFNSIDHHNSDPLFATASNIVQIWDETKTSAISNLSFPTSAETIKAVRFNLSETSVLASVGTDRTFTLYDIRTGKAERRVIMQMSSNDLSWSPTFPTTVLLASEDHNLYTFDIRNLTNPSQIYKGHVAAVMSCDWAPTGLEFVSGGWDRTLRIWKEGRGHNPEVYHTKRMQRVSSALFTSDARFVLSGSDDGNVRIWKAKASERLGIVTGRERAAIEYRESLKERWKADQQVGKVSRFVPHDFDSCPSSDMKQPATHAQGSLPGKQTQAHHVGCSTGQGREETKTHTGWRRQAQGRAPKSCRYRADVAHTTDFCIHYPGQHIPFRMRGVSVAVFVLLIRRHRLHTSPHFDNDLRPDMLMAKLTVPPTSEEIVVSIPQEHVLLITFNRPRSLNAMTPQMSEDVARVMAWFEDEASLWVVVITGAGRLFCAGADLKAWNKNEQSGKPQHPDTIVSQLNGFGSISRRESKKPFIAAVNGGAYGGGTEMVLNCDLVVASNDAKFGLPEVKRGVVAIQGGIPRLVRLAGQQLASEMLLLGSTISAEDARNRFGFVNVVVPPSDVLPTALQLAEQIVNNSPDGVQSTKRAMLLTTKHDNEGTVAAHVRSAESLDQLYGDNIKEGLKAFGEKRTPKWNNPGIRTKL